jgi:hypothetical protein
MTEQEWLSADDPDPLLKWLQRSKRHRPTTRKLQLLANAIADRVADRFTDPLSVELRQFMDRLGEATPTRDAYWGEWGPLFKRLDAVRLDHTHILCWAIYVSAPDGGKLYGVPETCVRSVAGYVRREVGDTERVKQVHLLRDVIPNPYRPVTFSHSWRTDTAVSVARGMYESRDFGAMPILADALQDAGCDNEDVLNHCRDAKQVHVRGCWVVDLVLGKA